MNFLKQIYVRDYEIIHRLCERAGRQCKHKEHPLKDFLRTNVFNFQLLVKFNGIIFMVYLIKLSMVVVLIIQSILMCYNLI